MYNLSKAEENYSALLNDQQRKLFTADNEQLAKIRSFNDPIATSYADVALLLNTLHSRHQQYNQLYEDYGILDDFKSSLLDQWLDDSFNFNISFGPVSAVVPLRSMDNCQALYDFLAQIKITMLEMLIDCCNVEQLAEAIS